MNSSLADEILSINAIYGDKTLVAYSTESQMCLLQLPSLSGPTFKLSFPLEYPHNPPEIIGTETLGSSGIRAGQGKHILERIRNTLDRVYQSGSCCIYDLIEDCNDLNIQTLVEADRSREGNSRDQQQHQQHDKNIIISSNNISIQSPVSPDPQKNDTNDGSIPTWTISNPVTAKKSVFVARVATVHSQTQAQAYLDHLLATDKKVGRATHNINAWRIRGDIATTATATATTTSNTATAAAAATTTIIYQDSDDDGETAAGARLLHLLQLMDAWNVIVVVSRWYGGVHLGPDRFRLINAAAREALVKAGANAKPGSTPGAKSDK